MESIINSDVYDMVITFLNIVCIIQYNVHMQGPLLGLNQVAEREL